MLMSKAFFFGKQWRWVWKQDAGNPVGSGSGKCQICRSYRWLWLDASIFLALRGTFVVPREKHQIVVSVTRAHFPKFTTNN